MQGSALKVIEMHGRFQVYVLAVGGCLKALFLCDIVAVLTLRPDIWAGSEGKCESKPQYLAHFQDGSRNGM